LLLIWSGFYFGLRYYRQYQTTQLDRLRLDAAVKDAELRALKAQLNPHFLFNSLNILRALIPQNLAQPREALTLLADLLRASLNSGHEETIPLARELETVENYLALERLRFEDRLTVHRTIASPALAWPMPPFVVQTLVENAVKFGIATREAGGAIILVAAVKNGFLHLRVLNPGTIDGASVSTGLGLKNARSRLALLFGPHATLTLAQAAPDLVAAEVRLPPLAATARASAP
jgi:LytS/YehU family sensor histidine kinase